MALSGKRPNQPVGIREVAERAGVGIASVSRVLSGHPGATPRISARVLDAARELGYTPNMLAQGLRLRQTRTVGFVGSDITNPLISAIVRGAESVLTSAGFSVLLTDSGGVPEADGQRIELLKQRRVDGLIVLPVLEDEPSTLAALRGSGVPAIVIDRSLPDDIDAHYVLSDHYAGIGEAAHYLLKHGHRRIGLAVGRDVRPSRERIRALTDAYETLGVPPQLIVDSGTLSDTHGEDSMARFLDAAKPPTAVVLGGNQLLEGALRVVRQRGLKLGEDLSLVCCDDIPLSRLFDPPIATVMRDTGLLGQQAAQILLQQIESPQPTQPVVLPTWFERRASCAPRARAATRR